ncbi:MAG TPA: trehalase family glycosidase [Rubrobacteraceae bacterium]|nr:trehalase family glycosidase [Rubrobacteraceae bacterium]
MDTTHDSKTDLQPKDLAARAERVLRDNDMGVWTKAAPSLYPHQWSWDSAFIAIGIAHYDTARAAEEIRCLLDHQWATGKVPHIVFNPDAPPESYFPGPEHWASAAPNAPAAPAKPATTSGLCQPPVHAIAARRILEIAERRDGDAAGAREFLREIYPKLLFWHRYLMTARDPEESGLVTIYHPWESGTDNSPRWQDALDRVEVREKLEYERRDLQHVDDPSERPTQEVYDRFIWLVQLITRSGCDDAVVYATSPFLVKDVLMSAILVRANEALLEISELVGAPDEDRNVISAWISRGRRGLTKSWDPEIGLCLDYDLRAGAPLKARTVAGFAPLIAGIETGRRSLLQTLDSALFAGHSKLRWPLPPSTSPEEPLFDPRRYWRGPVWPVINWLLWWSLERSGEDERAARLRRDGLAQLADGTFSEYYEPFTGEPLGSDRQSWTAAVLLDWLANGQM